MSKIQKLQPEQFSCADGQVACPRCGGHDFVEDDLIPGEAQIQGVFADGSIEWVGYTEIDWNGQRPAGKLKFRCTHCGKRASDLRRWIVKARKK